VEKRATNEPVNIRRVMVRTVVIVIGLMVVCAVCNLIVPMVLPVPGG
jgi:hypothetical protein